MPLCQYRVCPWIAKFLLQILQALSYYFYGLCSARVLINVLVVLTSVNPSVSENGHLNSPISYFRWSPPKVFLMCLVDYMLYILPVVCLDWWTI